MRARLATSKKSLMQVYIPDDATFSDYMRLLKLIKLQMKTYMRKERS